MKIKLLSSFRPTALLFVVACTYASGAMAQSSPTVSNDAANVYYSIPYSGTPKFVRIYLDTDHSRSTGFGAQKLGVGAEYLLENGYLYRYAGNNGSWQWNFVKSVSFTSSSGVAKVRVDRAALGSPAQIDLVTQTTPPIATSPKISQNLTFTATAPVTTTSPVTTSPVTTSPVTTSPVTTSPFTISPVTTSPTTTPAPTTPKITETAPTTPPLTTDGPFTKPTLVNPVSPLSYGAKCDGVTNDAAAFQSALNASDVLVPAGKTCVVNSTVQISTNDRHLECEAGAVIKQTNLNAAALFHYIAPGNGRMSGNSIVNCTFIGTNTVPPQANWNDDTKHYNIPVKTEDRVDNFLLAGNTFDRFWGQSMFQTYGGVDGGMGDQIVYNTFKNCAYYGPVLVAHQNGYIGHNTMVDCATGVENDNPGQLNGGNVIEFNTLTCAYGYGGADMGACAMLSGGVGGKSNNSGNIVRNNTISGTSNGQGPQGVKGSRLIIGKNWAAEGVIPAQYSNNVCGPGCVITP